MVIEQTVIKSQSQHDYEDDIWQEITVIAQEPAEFESLNVEVISRMPLEFTKEDKLQVDALNEHFQIAGPWNLPLQKLELQEKFAELEAETQKVQATTGNSVVKVEQTLTEIRTLLEQVEDL